MALDELLFKTIKRKADHFETVIKNRHLIEGLVLPTLVSRHEGEDDHQTGNFENCAIWTGAYVAAQALKFSKTKDPEAKLQAQNGVLALHKLQEVTGIPGVLARGYKIRAEPSWDESFFWKKHDRKDNEWHQNGKYRWLGDASKSQVFGVTLGYFAYNQFCQPSKEEKALMAHHFTALVDSITRSQGKIIDEDGKVSGYGDYTAKSYWGFGGVGPSLRLTQVKLALILSERGTYDHHYRWLLNDMHYKSLIERCRLDPPVLKKLSTAFGSEDNLAMLNYFVLSNLDPSLKDEIVRGIEKRWSKIEDPENSLFNFIYHAVTKKNTPDVEKGINALYRFPIVKTVNQVVLKRKLPDSKVVAAMDVLSSYKLQMSERPKDEYAWRVNPWRRDEWRGGLPGRMEFTGVDYLLAMYLGMHEGFIA